MSIPSLPAQGSTAWYAWAQALHAAASSAVQASDLGTGNANDAALRAALVPKWAPSTAVTAGSVWMAPDGTTIQRNANGTTRASYDATEQAAWTVTSSGGGGGGAITSVNGKTGVVVLSASDVGADASGAASSAQAASLQKSSNLSDLASAATARTNLGLGTAATQPSSAFDAAGAAAAVLPAQTGNSGKYLTTNGTAASWGTPAGGSGLLTFNTQSGTTYTFALGDGNGSTQVEFTSASAVTATIPLHSAVAFPVGTVLLVSQQGAGQVTVTPTAGVTLHTPNGAKTAQQYSVVSVVQRAFDEWTVSGDAAL